jgi:transcriptional regulator with XRE-family HTH domain
MTGESKFPTTRRPGSAAILTALRRTLKARGLRARDVAEAVGVAEPTVWRWLRGDGLTLDRLDEICALADLDLRDLLALGDEDRPDVFTLAQERVLAADRGLALVFFAILEGAQLAELDRRIGLPPTRLDAHLDRLKRLGLVEQRGSGRLRPRVRRSVRWRRGGPLSMSFERTVKPHFLSMDFGSPDALYVSDMVAMSAAGRARVHALFEALREDIYLIGEQERAAHLDGRDWSGVLMMVRPLNLDGLTSEWRTAPPEAAPD